MRKLSILSIILSLFLFACTKPESDTISQISQNMEKHRSLHFKVTEKTHYSNGLDTTITPFEVWAIRDESDSLRNGFVCIDNNYRPYNMIYENGDLFLAIPPKKTSILYTKYAESLISDVDWIDVFLKPELLIKMAKDSLNEVNLKDTLYQSKKCRKLSIRFHKDKNNTTKTYVFILDKQTDIPVYSLLVRKTKDYTFFDELSFTASEFDNCDKEKLSARNEQILKDNPVETGNANSETSRLELMLHPGDSSPLFDGKFYADNADFRLKDYIGKNVIIVDFWYTHCPPCVRAMPALSDLYTKFKDKGLKIFGLNSVDNQPNSLDYLNKFLAKRQLSYDIVLITPDVDIKYKINGYPSMYVVDKEGKIAFVELGYDAGKFANLTKEIENLLSK